MTNSTRRILLMAGALVAAGLTLAGCGSDSSTTPTPPRTPAPAPTTPTPAPAPTPEPPAQPEEATYDITYEAFISDNALLQQLQGATPFPEGVSSATGVVMGEHPPDVPLWESGAMASEGLKMLAETGDPSALIAEAESQGIVVRWRDASAVANLIIVTQEITLSYAAPCISYAQAITPSPDWFVGFAGVCAVDAETGEWLDEVSFSAAAFDAGTDDGDDYTAEDAPSSPQQPIMRLDKAPFIRDANVSRITGTLRQES